MPMALHEQLASRISLSKPQVLSFDLKESTESANNFPRQNKTQTIILRLQETSCLCTKFIKFSLACVVCRNSHFYGKTQTPLTGSNIANHKTSSPASSIRHP